MSSSSDDEDDGAPSGQKVCKGHCCVLERMEGIVLLLLCTIQNVVFGFVSFLLALCRETEEEAGEEGGPGG